MVPALILDSEHDPPGMIVLSPGLYEHECPRCGAKQRFRVPEPPALLSPASAPPVSQLDAVGITPADKITTTGKVSWPLRVYDHRGHHIGWTTQNDE